jgi:nitrogen fixation/metabolism regulation signal transduction histidine kinase
LWEKGVETQINGVLLPVIGAIFLLIFASLILAVLLVRMIARPIARLTDLANGVSADNLESPVENRVIG